MALVIDSYLKYSGLKKADKAFDGKLKVRYYGWEGSYAAVLEDPTWGDFFRFATKALKKTDDYHHVYFEGVRRVKTRNEKGVAEEVFDENGLPIYEIIMGS